MTEKKGLAEPGAATLVSVKKNGQDVDFSSLMTLAVQADGGVEKLEKIMLLQERWERNLARKEFFRAMSLFQSQCPVIKKRGEARFAHNNGQGETAYTYAKIEDIAEAIKPSLSKGGLSYRFEQTMTQGASGPLISVACVVAHKSGHEERAEMDAYPDSSGKKNPIQQLASAVSYLRRYTLTGVLGITVSDEDDDGAGAGAGAGDGSADAGLPEDQFNANFPGWKNQIQGGSKTAEQLIAYISRKGVALNEGQLNKINSIEA